MLGDFRTQNTFCPTNETALVGEMNVLRTLQPSPILRLLTRNPDGCWSALWHHSPPPSSPPPLYALLSPTVDAGRLFMDAGFGVAKPKPAKKKKAAKRPPVGAGGGIAKGQRKAESFVYTGSLRPGVRSPRRAVRTNCEDLVFFFFCFPPCVQRHTPLPCTYIITV